MIEKKNQNFKIQNFKIRKKKSKSKIMFVYRENQYYDIIVRITINENIKSDQINRKTSACLVEYVARDCFSQSLAPMRKIARSDSNKQQREKPKLTIQQQQ
jgi:flagellar biosynthesis protein FliP